MKIKLLFLFIGTCLPIYLINQFKMDGLNKYSNGNNPNSKAKIEFEGTESWAQRYEWELNRLKDPATGRIPDNIAKLEQDFVNRLPGSMVNIKNGKNNYIQAGNEWTRRGPYYIGGRTRALVLDIKNEKRIIAGSVDGGIYVSTDGGLNWVKKSLPDQMQSVTCLTQDTRAGKEKIWYYGTGEFQGSITFGNGIYKSTDNGETWFALKATQTGLSNKSFDNAYDYVTSIVTNPAAPSNVDEVYASFNCGGIGKSTDGGQTWKTILGGVGLFNYSVFTDIKVSPKGVFYAALSQRSDPNNPVSTSSSPTKGIFRSTDGVKWVDITPKKMPAKYGQMALGISPADENIVYLVTESPNSGLMTHDYFNSILWHSLFYYKYVSGDGKDSTNIWEDRSLNLPNGPAIIHQMNSQGGYNLWISTHPKNPNIVYLGAVDLVRSDDGFTTPKYTVIGGTCPDGNCPYFYRYLNHHSDEHAWAFLPSNPDGLFTGSDGGIHYTSNALSDKPVWNSLNNGYFSTQFYSVAIDQQTAGNEIVVGGLQDNGTVISGANKYDQQWNEATRGDGFMCQMMDGGKYSVTSMNSLYQPKVNILINKLDAVGNVIASQRIDPIGGKDFPWAAQIAIDHNDNNYLYVAGGRMVWRQSKLTQIQVNGGKDSISFGWDSLDLTTIVAGNSISSIAVSKSPANILFYGTNGGQLFRIDNANIGNPKPVKLNIGASGNVGCICIDPTDANKILVVLTNYNIKNLYYSEDGGTTFRELKNNLEGTNSPAILWVEILKKGAQTIYFCGTSVGLFSTSNLDKNFTVWVQESPELIGNTYTAQIAARSIDGFVAAGTHAHGMFNTYITNYPSLSVPSFGLVYPQDKKMGVMDTINLIWEKNKNFYFHVQVSNSPTFDSIYAEYYGLDTNQKKISGLSPGIVTYYWRVRGQTFSGFGAFSEVRQFSTILGAPTLNYPASTQDNVPIPTLFQWSKVDGATSYSLQVSTSLAFTTIFFQDSNITNNEYLLDKLNTSQKYFWRVRALNSDGISAWAKYTYFTTAITKGIEDNQLYGILSSDLIKNLIVSPNPVGNNCEFSFNTSISGATFIKIFDNTGREVKFLSTQFVFSGENKIDLDLVGLPRGIYYLVVEIANNRKSIKFVKN